VIARSGYGDEDKGEVSPSWEIFLCHIKSTVRSGRLNVIKGLRRTNQIMTTGES